MIYDLPILGSVLTLSAAALSSGSLLSFRHLLCAQGAAGTARRAKAPGGRDVPASSDVMVENVTLTLGVTRMDGVPHFRHTVSRLAAQVGVSSLRSKTGWQFG